MHTDRIENGFDRGLLMNQSFSSGLKRGAIGFIRETKPSPLFASLLLFAVNSIVSWLNTFLTGSYYVAQDVTTAMLSGREVSWAQIYELAAGYSSFWGTVLSIALSLCVAVISAGFAWYCLRVVKGESPEARSVLDSFGRFLKIIWLNIVMGFLIAVQFILLIVPGVIATLRYSQAVYIMYEHPEYSVMQCIRESGRMMRGHKLQYFVLLLSFLGWWLLGYLFSLYIPIPVLDIWISIYWGLAAALFHIYLIRVELSGEARDGEVNL